MNDTVVRLFVSRLFRREKLNIRPQNRERCDLAGRSVLASILSEISDNHHDVLSAGLSRMAVIRQCRDSRGVFQSGRCGIYEHS